MIMVFARKTQGVSGFIVGEEFKPVVVHAVFDSMYDKFFESEEYEVDYTETERCETVTELKKALLKIKNEYVSYSNGRLL